MTDDPGASQPPATVDEGSFPNTLSRGQTLLVACPGDPTPFAVGLQALCRFGDSPDTAIVVTTTTGATETIERYTERCPGPHHPGLRVLDTTSRDQSLEAVYDETPIIYTPSPGDLERLTIGISELATGTPTTDAERHFIVRSLTPILDAAPTDRVCTVLARTTGLRTQGGLSLIGIDYTAHDEPSMRAIAAETDGILWVTQPTPTTLDLDYQPNADRYTTPTSDT